MQKAFLKTDKAKKKKKKSRGQEQKVKLVMILSFAYSTSQEWDMMPPWWKLLVLLSWSPIF